MSDKFTIRIKMADSIHPLSIKREDEEKYRKAAKLVDTRFADYREKYRNVDLNSSQFLSFVALEFAVKYLTVDENKNVDELNAKIEELTEEVELFIKQR